MLKRSLTLLALTAVSRGKRVAFPPTQIRRSPAAFLRREIYGRPAAPPETIQAVDGAVHSVMIEGGRVSDEPPERVVHGRRVSDPSPVHRPKIDIDRRKSALDPPVRPMLAEPMPIAPSSIEQAKRSVMRKIAALRAFKTPPRPSDASE